MNIYLAYFLVGITVLAAVICLPLIFSEDSKFENGFFRKWVDGALKIVAVVITIYVFILVIEAFILAFVTVSEHLT